MFPVSPDGYGDLINNEGLAGQGEITPLEKVFDFHFIVKIPAASGNQYYDPSYGSTYSSELGFEAQAVVGYASQNFGDDPTSGNYHFRTSAGVANISFLPNTNFSM